MVLDLKAFEWASANNLDTATLKKAKIPIYGKWYFPDLPADVPLINLQTGAVETFGAGYRAGAVLYVKEDDLVQAGLGPYKDKPPAVASEEGSGATTPEPSTAESQAESVASASPAGPVGERPRAAEAERSPSVFTGDRPIEDRPTTERTLGTDDLAVAGTAASVRPSASSTMPSVGEEHPMRMLDHEDEQRGVPRAGERMPVGEAGQEGHAAPSERAHQQAHPSSRVYINIAVILAVITAVEVATYYIPALAGVIVPILLVLSLAKFVLVVGYFMHLKFDHKM